MPPRGPVRGVELLGLRQHAGQLGLRLHEQGLAPYLADLDTRRSPARDKASQQRLGANRRRAPGGRHPKLTLADQITATLLHQHLALPTAVLARLLGVSKDTARHAVNQTQQLLDQHGFTPPHT
ncbi:MAG: transposase [Actinomycetia bacterium]|nr:transposase [Actinomycetes bacterium]